MQEDLGLKDRKSRHTAGGILEQQQSLPVFLCQLAHALHEADLKVDTHRDSGDADHPVGIKGVLKRPDDGETEG